MKLTSAGIFMGNITNSSQNGKLKSKYFSSSSEESSVYYIRIPIFLPLLSVTCFHFFPLLFYFKKRKTNFSIIIVFSNLLIKCDNYFHFADLCAV